MIVETYFQKHSFAKDAQRIIDELILKLKFRIDRPLFRGNIYDASRLESIIFRGVWKKKDVVLKIQGLRLPRDEKDLTDAFTEQNQSARIRTPHIYKHAPWDESKGYGFTLMEYIDAPALLSMPVPQQTEIDLFMRFFTELKTKAVTSPWIEKTEHQQSSVRFIRHRITQWIAIAKDRGHFDAELLAPRIEAFNERLENEHPEIPMEFMHSHMTGREVRYIQDRDQFILFGNLFWDWRPKYYDCAFVIWNLLKHPDAPATNDTAAISVINEWKKRFVSLPWIASDQLFPSMFDMMMLERLLGTLIIDIEAQDYKQETDKQALFERLLAAFDALVKNSI